jgi:transposase
MKRLWKQKLFYMEVQGYAYHDKVTHSTGQCGFTNGKRIFAAILKSVFTQAFYTTPVVCNIGFEAILKDRLSRYHPDVKRFFRLTQSFELKEDTPLFYTLLCRKKATKKRAFEQLLASIFSQAYQAKLIEDCPVAAIDATGLETRYTSRHFIHCRRRESFYRRNWPKLTIVCDIKTHLIAGCIVTRGPSMDFPNLEKVMSQSQRHIRFNKLLADAGYDSEANHVFCRERLNIRSTVIAYNPRRTSKLPASKYRRQMATQFDSQAYRQRWQVESVFSRHKRLLGSALRNRTSKSRKIECLLRVLTHNLMIIRRAA